MAAPALSSCLATNLDLALGEYILDVARAQYERDDEPRRLADHLRREPMSLARHLQCGLVPFGNIRWLKKKHDRIRPPAAGRLYKFLCLDDDQNWLVLQSTRSETAAQAVRAQMGLGPNGQK